MRLVNIKYVQEGSLLAKPIRNSYGRILLGEGVALDKNYLSKLKDIGYDMVFIQDERFQDIEIGYAITDKTKEIAYNAVRGVTDELEKNPEAEIDADSVRYAVLNLVQDLLHSSDILSNLTDINGYDEYTYHHSINTTVLALMLGIGKGFTQNQLLELGMGVLMHDIGKTKISKEILNKKGKLEEEEFQQIKAHPLYGYEYIRGNRDFSILSAHVALQHHEKWKGGGYPRGLRENEIHEYARIASVADVYEALTSKRPYRDAMPPYLAYEYVIVHSGLQFDPEIVCIFAQSVAPYPVGTGIELSNGLRGVVIKQNPILPTRPVVRVIAQGDQALDNPDDLDLSKHLSTMITSIVDH
ncbi:MULTISPECIES: HD-GYP domain-containing protein [unclassified Dehalobacter]|uniref:HD-GYP domain-containing protein n=1 Tax=unclassified Dehalobacter TaxID=2635733 RepID=UPI00104A43A1|nr:MULTISPECIES: HD-GYP domain-containing protein [unclassified Dehalobacter]TCX53289.1 HD-GYP domain-containing protein [Dehalobacter sp. 14DCB1]TCX54303.1 HD-GYP domain-containing protein [Dehalobacter sp. 12DCB1]